MGKNIIFIIAFVAVYAFLGFYFASTPNNDSSDYSNGGSITNSVYQNTKYGFSLDLGEDWVYFTPRTLDQVEVAKYGINLDDVADGTVLLGFAQPGKSGACAKLDEAFTSQELNLKFLRDVASVFALSIEETGGSVFDYDSGLIGTSSEVYYFYIDFEKLGERDSIIYVLFNTDKDTTILMYVYCPIDERNDFIRFFEKNLRVDKYETDMLVTSM